MKQYILFVLIISLIFVSCNNNNIKRPKKPKNLIKKEMMANILYDMSILTASKGVNKKLLEEKGILPENFVFDKYGIDSTQFVLSNEYYAFDLDTYEQIFEDVKDRLALEKTYLDSLNNIEAEKNALERKNRDIDTLMVRNNIKKLIELSEISTNSKKNLIPFSEEISYWNKYVSGFGIEPVIVDNESISPDGKKSMSSVRLNLGGGVTNSDRSMIRVLSIPIEGDFVYSFWVKAKTPSDVGKTIRIKPETGGGVERIYTLTDKLERINVKNKVSKKVVCTFIIEIRGGVTNAGIVEFYLWGVQLEKSDKVTNYAPRRDVLENDLKYD